MRRVSFCPFVHFWLAMLIVLVGAPNSSAAERKPEDQLPSANSSAGAIRSVFQAPVFGFKAGKPAPSLAQQGQPGTPRELLPELGQIGAQVSLLLGVARNPFEAEQGLLAGGQIDLPLVRVGGGKISYQIAVTNQMATTDVLITSPLSAVGDLLKADGLGGTLTSKILSSLKNVPAEEDLDLLTVLPFGLKYTVMSLDHVRVRPYIVGSFGVYVTITDQTPNANLAAVDSRLGGGFIGGIAPEAIELTARGVPEGQGDIRFGGNVGGGVEFRIAARSSLGVEYRFHKVGDGPNGTFSTVVGKIGLHF